MSENNLHEAEYAAGATPAHENPHDPNQEATWEAVSHDPHVAAQRPNPEIQGLTYEQARDQLIEIVSQLEAGRGGLEESLKLWEKGEALAAHCQAWLDGAQNRLNQAMAARQQQ